MLLMLWSEPWAPQGPLWPYGTINNNLSYTLLGTSVTANRVPQVD